VRRRLCSLSALALTFCVQCCIVRWVKQHYDAVAQERTPARASLRVVRFFGPPPLKPPLHGEGDRYSEVKKPPMFVCTSRHKGLYPGVVCTIVLLFSSTVQEKEGGGGAFVFQ